MQIDELQSTKIARLNIVKSNDAPLPPIGNAFEIQVAPGVTVQAKMRRGCYNRPQSSLNAQYECVNELAQDPEALLPMTVDIDRDPLRFIITKLPEKGVIRNSSQYSGEFYYSPNLGVNADWDSFQYYITDCPVGCTPASGCVNKDPPGCVYTATVTVNIRIGNPIGMRARSKSYQMLEDTVLASGYPELSGPGNITVELQRSTFEEAGWSEADGLASELRFELAITLGSCF